MDLFSTAKRQFGWFLAFNALLWTLVPSLFYRCLPLDTAETVSWGSAFALGNSKHPPLPGGIAYWFSALFAHTDFSLFLLSQLCVALGLIYLYRLAREFLEEKDAVASALLVTFYYYYNWESVKYNVNLPQLAFLPMMVFYFVRGVKSGSVLPWLFCGATAAAAFLCKYVAVLFFAALFAYLLFDRDARRHFAKPGPYLAAAVFLLLILPHLVWLFRNDFAALGYFQQRESGHVTGYFRNLLETIGITAAPLLAAFAADAAARFLGGGLRDVRSFACHQKGLCCGAVMELFPILMLLLLALGGMGIHYRWLFPFSLFSGLLICSLRPPVSDKAFRWLLRGAFCFSLVLGLIMAGYLACRTKERHHLDQAQLGEFAASFYREKTGRELTTIAGEMFYAATIQRAHHYRIKVFLHNDPSTLPRLKPEFAKGTLFVGRSPAELQTFAEVCGVSLSGTPEAKDFTYKAPFGKTATLRLWFAAGTGCD